MPDKFDDNPKTKYYHIGDDNKDKKSQPPCKPLVKVKNNSAAQEFAPPPNYSSGNVPPDPVLQQPVIPPQQNYSEPPMQNYAEPPLQNYAEQPMQNYADPPLQNYAEQPMQNYQQPNYQPYPEPQQPDMYNNNNGTVPPPYTPPQMPQQPESPKEKKGNSTIILMVIIIVLLLAIIGLVLFIYLKNNKDDDTSSKNSAAVTETTSQQNAETTEEITIQEAEDPENAIVPDLVGTDYRTADMNLKKAGLEVGLEFTFSNDVENNLIISQDVAPNTEVAKGTKIKLVVSQGKESSKKVMVPNVRGLSFEEASNVLASVGLNSAQEYEANENIAKGKVIDQKEAPGTEIYEGSVVVLIVSSGKAADEPTTKPAENAETNYRSGVVQTEETDLNVRKSPSADSELLGTLTDGTEVKIVSEDNGWYEIVYNDGTAYVSKDYVNISE
ncbi:MAG: PASTA domain-containing protein [Ruminococcus sp.]|nr:PASTA domain-containing protein [Ruminococcus sp.]